VKACGVAEASVGLRATRARGHFLVEGHFCFKLAATALAGEQVGDAADEFSHDLTFSLRLRC
jgi:hypothetical protein